MFLIVISTHPIIVLRIPKHVISKINTFLIVVKVGSKLRFAGSSSLLSPEAMEPIILFPMFIWLLLYLPNP